MSSKSTCVKPPKWAGCSGARPCRFEEPRSHESIHIIRLHGSAALLSQNEETATNNHYQRDIAQASPEEIIERHKKSSTVWWTSWRLELRSSCSTKPNPMRLPTPCFPTIEISTHADGTVALYPMFAPNRRTERREDVPLVLEHQFGFDVRQIIDFTEFESHNKFLEGTGSIVLDRINRKAYAALSDRTDARALEHFCDQLDFEPVAFQAFQTVDNQRLPIYHTNVMMSIGSGYAVVCLDCIDSDDERKQVVDAIAQDGLELIAITEEQVNQFAGNMLELTGTKVPSWL